MGPSIKEEAANRFLV